MTFGTTLALLVGLLAALPIVAHLLRRGKTEEIEFPPAHLVPAAVVTSDKRSRLEDKALLGLRFLSVLLLAVLGATPFVKCSHLAVDRAAGASVALAIVLDDSQSMRAVASGSTRSRFELAKAGALQLLGSAREGDAIAVVGAGTQARLLLNATTDLESARQVIASLEVSDRATDLGAAVALARASLKDLPHADKRVALLSDQHDKAVPAGEPPLWIPLPDLAKPVPNCGIAEALRTANEVQVDVGCTNEDAATNQRIELRLDGPDGDVIQERVLEARSGVQHVTFTKVSHELASALAVRLTNKDGIETDNVATVTRETTGLMIGVVADREKTSAITGGAPLIEQAFDALGLNVAIKPLSQVPDTREQLQPYAALVVDDPRGFSPETRAALDVWLSRGGVLLGLLGPSSVATELASSSEPFARPGIQWETNATAELDATSLGLLGADAKSLVDLRQIGRVRLDAADLPGTVVRGTWKDGVPFLFERAVGLGTVLTLGLPTAFEISELAIRPGFLALLHTVGNYAETRSGPRRTFAGVPWLFPEQVTVTLEGEPALLERVHRSLAANQPDAASALAPASAPQQPFSAAGSAQQQLVPALTGSYRLMVDGRPEQRAVTLDAKELYQSPELAQDGPLDNAAGASASAVDASPYWALVVLALFALELGWRAFRSRSYAS